MADNEEDLEALFDTIAANRTQAVPVATEVVASTESSIEASDATVSLETSQDLSVESAPLAQGSSSESQLYGQLGGIVRQLHTSLRELGYDQSLSEAANQINDAKDRLDYLATLTEQAANKVLNALDEGMPAQERLAERAKDIESRWGRLFDGQMSVEEFKQLAQDARSFSTEVAASAETEKARMLEIMMAQDFQDLTGQIIKKVIAVTKTVERDLAELLRDNAPEEVRDRVEKPVNLLNGPERTAMGQDDVDDLLAGLGF